MVGSEGGGGDVVSNVFVVRWLSDFVGRACNGQFAWRSWFCTDTLEVCLMTVSKSPRRLDGALCGSFCVFSVFRCSWSFDMSHGVMERMDVSNGTTHCGQTTYIVQSAVVGRCRECSS